MNTNYVEAWDLIGDEGIFRIKGGRATYDSVLWLSEDNVRLARLESYGQGVRQINRTVKPDTMIEVIRNYTEEQA